MGTAGVNKQKTTLAKVVETGFLITTWLALGLYLEIYGPTQIDLKLKLNSDYEHIAVAVSGRSVGLFPGCVLGGLLADKLGKYSHLMVAVSLDIAAIVTIAAPFSPNVELLWFLCFVGGLVESVINIAGQRLILKLWLEKSTTPMILLHSGYGIGSFLIPLYTNPFLAVKRLEPMGNDTLYTGTSEMPPLNFTSTSPLSEYTEQSKIEYSYMISAALVALHSISFYVYQFRERKYKYDDSEIELKESAIKNDKAITEDIKLPQEHTERTWVQMVNPATCTGGRFWYGITLFFLLFFYFANAGGGERVVAGFIRSFSIDQLGFSKDDASYLNTSFWISFTVGRLMFSVAARWISVRILVIIQTGGLTLVTVLMTIFARNNSLACWILVQPLGIFIAPIWPSGVAWTDYHLELTGLGMMIILLGGSVGGICHQRLIGYLYEHLGPHMFLYQCIGYGAFALLLAISLDIVGARHGNRFQWSKKAEIASDVTSSHE